MSSTTNVVYSALYFWTKSTVIIFSALYMECQRGLATRKLSVCPSVCQTRKLWQQEESSVEIFSTIPNAI